MIRSFKPIRFLVLEKSDGSYYCPALQIEVQGPVHPLDILVQDDVCKEWVLANDFSGFLVVTSLKQVKKQCALLLWVFRFIDTIFWCATSHYIFRYVTQQFSLQEAGLINSILIPGSSESILYLLWSALCGCFALLYFSVFTNPILRGPNGECINLRTGETNLMGGTSPRKVK